MAYAEKAGVASTAPAAATGESDGEGDPITVYLAPESEGSSDTPFLLIPSSEEPSALHVDELPGADRPLIEPAGRLFDLAVGLLLLMLVLPLMAACAIAVLLSGPGPILYRQARIGRDGRQFGCLKFRTMVDLAEHRIDDILRGSAVSQEEWLLLHKLRSDPRVTPVGRVLRRYCMDELPQLFNVIAGDMSVVGPRPIVRAEVEKFGTYFPQYCSVRPGLTGLWQVSGRHALSYEERVRLDADYARAKCLRLDLIILVKTIPIVLLGQNA